MESCDPIEGQAKVWVILNFITKNALNSKNGSEH